LLLVPGEEYLDEPPDGLLPESGLGEEYFDLPEEDPEFGDEILGLALGGVLEDGPAG
jgi:hypothetical protein